MTVHGAWSVRALVAVGIAAGCFALSLALPFNGLDRLGYDGWVGTEYNPRGETLRGLAWAKEWGLGPKG